MLFLDSQKICIYIPNFHCSIFRLLDVFFKEEVLTGTTVIFGAIFSFLSFRLFRLMTGLFIAIRGGSAIILRGNSEFSISITFSKF
jgi:hypothetical protein